LSNLGRALVLLQEIRDRNGEADALSVVGWICNSLGDYKRALDYFNQALPLRRVVGDRAGEATTLFGIAEVERQQGNLLNARNNMEAALGIIESLDTLGTRQELRISYFASVQNYYGRYIDLLQSLHNLYPDKGYDATAFNASERARARSLLDILAEIKVDIDRDIDPALVEKQRALLEQLDLTAEGQRQLSSQQPAGEAAGASKRTAALTSKYQEVEGQIRAASRGLAALAHPSPLTVAEIQQQVLDDSTLLLEYALGEERSYLWAVTQTAIGSFQLPRREVIESAARKVFDLITARSDRRAGEAPEQKNARVLRADMDYAAAAAALSRILLGTVANRLGSKRLLIVAQGDLNLIPFGALPDLTPGAGPGRPIKPLILDHEIVYMPSASTLAVLRRKTSGRKPAPKAIAVLADPVFSKEDERVGSAPSGPVVRIEKSEILSETAEEVEDQRAGDAARDVKPIERLPRLFATRWEAEQIASLVPAVDRLQALDFSASRALALSHDLAQYRIVHFATHAFIDNTHPELSGIVLSLVDRAGRKQDGFLSAREIFNLKLQSDLVVLSGCRTGGGKNVRGEGLIGLARGFMYAGAPRVLFSLWSLNDKATAELMVRFYRKLLGPERLAPVAALRSAQIEMFKDKRWQSPYSWAAFILEGEWQ
jgi:CHAT domain-containing protein